MEDAWSAVGGGDRDPRPEWFASGGVLDGAPPSGRVLEALEALALPSVPGGDPGPDAGGGPHGGSRGADGGRGSDGGRGDGDGDGGCGGVPFAGATHDETAGMLASVHALEGHVAGLKLAVVREIIRRHAPAVPGGAMPDPGTWDIGVLHEVAAILRVSVQSAGPVVELAWQLAARLPGAGALLDAGVLSALTARIISEEFSVLDADAVADAEKRLLEHDLAADDMTPGKIRRLCQRIADTVDPDGAARRREEAERDRARVRFFRSHGGSGTLFASGLPADEALKSDANVQKRALEYKGAGVKEKMDFLRVLALCDLTNGLPVHERVARWRAEQAEKQRTGADDPGRRAWEDERAREAEEAGRAWDDDRPPFPDTEPGDLSDRASDDDSDSGGRDDSGNGSDDGDDGDSSGRDDSGPGSGGSGGGTSSGGTSSGGTGPGPGSGDGTGDGSGRGGTGGAGPVPAGMPDPGLPTLVNLTCPLATVLGLAERPGEAPGYGSLDPALVRRLAEAAAASPRSKFCVTFTDQDGHAAAHGCARLIRRAERARRDERTRRDGRSRGTGIAGIAGGGRGGGEDEERGGRRAGEDGGTRDGPPPGTGGWDFTRDTTRPGPRGGYGAWILTLPGEPGTGEPRRYRVDMHKIPLHDCDHAYATSAYRPNDLLRHLVQIRDGECTFTGCSRPARDSDFDHAVPYHRGGATDACNAGMRSRRCHQVKQSPGWALAQPEPGWHTWTTPSGRSYTKGPKDYPA